MYDMFVNIAAYRFAHLTELRTLRAELIELCKNENLKGTILLSAEGVNLFVAGLAEAIAALLAKLRSVPGLEALEPKVSESTEQPFSRMLVKIKREIIAFGIPTVDPVARPAPRLSATELKQWLDAGKPVMLLDTRNDFEVGVGTFRNAQAIGIQRFRDFPAVADRLKPEEFPHPIVTFCTGGIRCEKAAPYLIDRGFQNVYQLEGGILKYFEEVGNDHFDGECFVFDKRVGLAADLDESGHVVCYACQSVLNPDEADDPRLVEGVSCPRCYVTPEDRAAAELAKHRELLKQFTTPLPGSVPKDNFRPLKISARHSGWTLLDVLCDVFDHLPREHWQKQFADGCLVNEQHDSIGEAQVVQPGQYYFTREPMQIEPAVNPAITILHEDDAIIVVNKPAPLPMHPSGRFHRNTLSHILREVYAPQKPRPAHRLDANTSGVVVFSRVSTFARELQPQFERGEVQKTYLARVQGHPSEDRFECHAAISEDAGEHGSRTIDEAGLASHTSFEVMSRDADGTSLLQVTPHTGRTNQIRLHLWHLGWPIVGDALYLQGRVMGDRQTVEVDDPPLCLHAWKLSFVHPQHGGRVEYLAAAPEWAATSRLSSKTPASPRPAGG
jgi:UPF0176 protein